MEYVVVRGENQGSIKKGCESYGCFISVDTNELNPACAVIMQSAKLHGSSDRLLLGSQKFSMYSRREDKRNISP